jgi:FkbM family methyltransferase
MLFSTFERFVTIRKGAIHVGAHEGQEREFYKRMGFEKVIWFEPNKDLMSRLIENISEFKYHKYYNVGIHDILKSAKLHISNNDGQSSSILELGKHAKYHPDVVYVEDQDIQLERMDEFLEKNKIDINEYNFLNVDVQGVELNVIKSFGKQIRKMDYIYLEVNDEELYKGCALLPEIDDYLRKYGFIRLGIKMTKCHWGDAFYKKY